MVISSICVMFFLSRPTRLLGARLYSFFRQCGVLKYRRSLTIVLLLFNHAEDFLGVLELRPWIFDKNLVVLGPLSARDDPLLVNLDWCPFFVDVHDLKLGQWTVEGFSDPGVHTPYGAWLRAVRPVRRFGVTLDLVWPTYVRSSPSSSGCSGSVHRGHHIFGGFRRRVDGGASLVARESGSTIPSPRRLAEHRQLDLEVGHQFNEQLKDAVSGPGHIEAQFPGDCPVLSRPASPSLGLADGRPSSRRASSIAGGPVNPTNIVQSGQRPADFSERNLGAKSLAGDRSSWPVVTPPQGLNSVSFVLFSRPVHSALNITEGSREFVGSSTLVEVPLTTQPSTFSAIVPVSGRGYGHRARGRRVGSARRI
ncbi:hypothetical protein Salat_2504000 [Sesamum alatum]|uniref:DUF4283 domain-containing protein n=1 Tax=Sesamum alatum TaxID=300844 RepID=A0AAE1XRQ6_9LAMI|nr:hypothetical protein Salat_2504000 [Sesamum alatum]